MTRPIRPATLHQEGHLMMATNLIRAALEHAKRADSPRAATAIRQALKSVEGAQRHMRHRRRHTEETTP